MFALKCRIKVCPIVRHASWPTPGLTVTGLIVPLFSPFVVQHTSLVCGAEGVKERPPFGGVWGWFEGRGGG